MRARLTLPLAAAFALWAPLAVAQAYGQPPAPQSQGLEAGGLEPPPPIEEDPESAQTEQALEEADKEDSGRGLEFFWLNAEIGFQHLNLQTFKANDIVDSEVIDTKQTGLLYGAGLGLRIVFLTLGARFRLSNFSAWQLWTLGAEAGIRIPLGNVEPYITVGGGYASLGAFDTSDIGGQNADSADIKGYNLRLGGGVDVYITPIFSIGGSVNLDLVGLTRPAVSSGEAGSVYAADGSSVGFGVTGTAVLGLHF